MIAEGLPLHMKVGAEITGRTVVCTPDRIRWYGDGMLGAAAGEPWRVGSNIHTDPDYAKTQGLPGVIADGMISANWLSNMLVETFGRHYIETGELRAKFIKPVFLDVHVTSRGRVTTIQDLGDGTVRYTLEVWCEDQEGTKLTVGDASVDVRS